MESQEDSNEEEEFGSKVPFINRELLTLKYLYFCFGSAQVCFNPFINVWLESQGISRIQIGIISSIRQMTNLFGAPFWAGISDKHSVHKKVLFGTIALSVTLRVLLSVAEIFPLMLAMITFSEFNWSIGLPMLDRICISTLGENRKHHYGKQRLWSAVGFGGLAIPIGKLVEWMGNTDWFLYLHGFFGFILLMIVTVAPISSIKEAQAPFWKSLSIVANVKSLVFLSAMVIVGMQNGIIGNYVFLHLKSLGASNTLLGMCLMANTMTEIPAFYFSGEITKKITPEGGILLAAFVCAFRFFGYFLLVDPVWALPLELTNGITFGIMWASAVQIVSGLAPPHLTTTMQGILAAVHSGIGSMLGAAIGGILFQKYEAKFFLMSCALPIFLFFGFGGWVYSQRSPISTGNGSYSLPSENEEKMSPMVEMESDDDEPEPISLTIEKRSFFSRSP